MYSSSDTDTDTDPYLLKKCLPECEVQQGPNVAVHLVFENVLREQGASSDTNVAASARLEHSSRAPLRRLALDGVHAVLLTLALAVRPVFPVHWQGMRVVDDQWCLQACSVALLQLFLGVAALKHVA